VSGRVAQIPEAAFDRFLEDAAAMGRASTIAELLRTVAPNSRILPKARTVTLVLSEAEHRAFEHQLGVLGAAYFTPTRRETLMTVLGVPNVAGLAGTHHGDGWVIAALFVS
jgi:hypothetical protein